MERQQASQIWRDRQRTNAANRFNPLVYDCTVGNLAMLRAELGEKGLESVCLGLSRPIVPDAENVYALINDWECRSTACCFQGSADDLLRMEKVAVIAISYRHESKERWRRHGENMKSKMSDSDQTLLTEAIEQLKDNKLYSQVILWCDQVLSTRLSGEENSLGWYNAGLIPFAYLPVLALSTHLSRTELENRIWIKAERNLGRMSKGVVTADQLFALFHPFRSAFLNQPRDLAGSLMNPFGEGVSGRNLLRNVAFMILSGHWPEPDSGDHWYSDYRDMKKWAIYICCKPDRVELPALFETVTEVDFTEVLWSMQKLSVVPLGSGLREREYFIGDNHFYLKLTAWNPWISELWPAENSRISHYMGKLGVCTRFTWWTSRSSGNVFGCMAICFGNLPKELENLPTPNELMNATLVLAIKEDTGFTLFRRRGDPRIYRHSERNPNQEMKRAFASAAEDKGLNINVDEEWSLLFTWDSMDEAAPPSEILQISANEDMQAAVEVPFVLMGTTARLYKAAVARAGVEAAGSVIDTFSYAINSWNEHIRETFETYVTVKDSTSGPAWLEGYTKQHLTFGFLDFLTRMLFTVTGDMRRDEVPMHHHEVLMPLSQCVKAEVLKASRSCFEDIQLVTEELFGADTAQNAGRALDDYEIASFMLSGGFTSTFIGFAVEPFVSMVAKRWGYWRTVTRCRNGKMQMCFSNQRNVRRIAQRSTTLMEYVGLGLVRPGEDNCNFVLDISEVLTEEQTQAPSLLIGMEDTFSRADITSRFSEEKLLWDGSEVWLFDTTRCGDTEQGIVSCFNTGSDTAPNAD